MNCQEIASYLQRYLDRELHSDTLEVLVNEHLTTCASCSYKLHTNARLKQRLQHCSTRVAAPAHLRVSVCQIMSHIKATGHVGRSVWEKRPYIQEKGYHSQK